jgi:Flp pilus assembly protein TadD
MPTPTATSARLRQLDQDSAAAGQFQEALTIEPDRPIVLVHLAWIDMAGRRHAEARRWLDSAAAVNPGFYQAYAERASLRLITGDTAGARSDAQTAARLRPASEPFAGEDVLVALSRPGDTTAVAAHLLRLRVGAPGLEEHGVHRAVAWAALLAAAGRGGEATDFLENAKVAPAHLRMHLKEPRFDGLRGESRFVALMERLRVREAPGA